MLGDSAMVDEAPVLAGREVVRHRLANLLLDADNPRFGLQEAGSGQAELLDHIVQKFGVDDVLSSLSVNGYFDAEPIVCRRRKRSSKIVVVEGNRRLAACLILTQDERAANQTIRSERYGERWTKHGRPPVDPIPAIVFGADEDQAAILAYLGVRHIASARPWDSYAKAAWVANVVENNGLTIAQVAEVIGDRSRTVNRMLEGYYLVKQLTKSGHFDPENSLRKGRGSVTAYPFSWVYTILGYAAVREFLHLGDEDAHENPIKRKRSEDAGLVMRAMFGDKSKARNGAITDSRQLGALASTLAVRDKVRLLEQGKTLEEIETLTQPIEKRLSEGMATVRDELRDLIGRLSEQDIGGDAAEDLSPAATRNRRLAAELERKLKEIALGGEDDG